MKDLKYFIVLVGLMEYKNLMEDSIQQKEATM